MSGARRPPVIGFAAFSGTGKTTLLKKLIPLLNEHGLRLGLIKHAHHSFDVDHAGKDSDELRKAGAERVLIGSRSRWVLVMEQSPKREPTLADLLARLPADDLDLIIVEGFKRERFPKIELHRPSTQRPLLFPEDDSIIAIATDAALGRATSLPVLALNDTAAIADFVLRFAGRARPAASGREP